MKTASKNLPNGWECLRLEELLIEKPCNGLYKSGDFIGKGVLFLDINGLYRGLLADFTKARRIEVTEDEYRQYELLKGDILFNRVSKMPEGVGKAVVVDAIEERAVYESNMIRVRLNKQRADSLFIVYYLSSNRSRQELLSKANISNQASVNQQAIKSLEIPLPPLEEQRRIATILDKADGVRRKRKEAIALTEELLRSAFLEMFGDPVTNPKRWDVLPIGAISSRITKGESPKWQGYNYQNEGILFVTSENVLWGQINCSEPKFIPEQFHQKLNRSQLCANDVLINLVGASVGRTCLVPNEILPANINQAVAVVSLNAQVCEPSFLLSQLLNHSVQRVLLGQAVEFARANISLTNIRELPVIVPPMEYQMRWKHFCQRQGMMYERKATSVKELNNLFNSLLQRAFRGEL